MKVFNGAEFLESHACEISLSNGNTYVVKDLSDSAMDHISKIGEGSSMNDVRNVVAEALGTELKGLEKVGVVELQGALGFLSESLFNQS
jgi:hypothetical protein